MGVKNLWDILESCKKTLPLHRLQNKRLCIDLSCWIVQLSSVSKSHCHSNSKFYLQGLFYRLRTLIALNCSLIFVTDGSIPGIKVSTYRRRLNNGNEKQVAQTDANPQQICSLKRNMGSEFSLMIKEAQALGLALGIPCLDAVEEAEAQCALLNSELLCDGCFTSDSDAFLFGARTVYRDICLGDSGHVVCYELDDIKTRLGFGRNSMITFALLLGSDYSQGVYGMGRESACQLVKAVGDVAVLQKITSEGLALAKKGKNSKKQELPKSGNGQYILKGDEFSEVIDAYLKPKCHSADSEAVSRVLVQHPFQRIKLQQICAEFFGWPPDKTDEKILPWIAERDLRRFANIRSRTSELGFNIPLQEIPVSCPVSGIVKHRKVQGNECYEVSWKNIDGLISVVSADLLQSACPEMIVEFEEKRAEGKKQNKGKTKTKKSAAAMAEIDKRLQTLLLEIESESRAVHNISHLPIDSKTSGTGVHELNQEVFLNIEPIIVDHARSCSTKRIEVIDLLSPSPAIHTRRVSKFQQKTSQKIDVIDLSDTEIDQSPEHERKARELRSFIASLKEGIEFGILPSLTSPIHPIPRQDGFLYAKAIPQNKRKKESH
ncbi:flap endonuclease GEN-like 2 isoform X1 [Cucumis melo var. makuwa]|uniref:Flap endonuclease GEN-like 2 isoform X1 n=1 Tax=Cucumis melo var. makuwa TaxID=1194695 RepID=A0A5A7SR22_CUCMM|nr:flap endonuclease GEN-like 2 isoform X1 [Cucumis melo var. makuwa]